MKASQALEQIQKLIDEHGDIDLILYKDEFSFLYKDEFSFLYPVELIRVVKDKNDWPIDDSFGNPVKLPAILVSG